MSEPAALRRDAARNHQLVLAAARDVLAEAGADACMEQIAARAGVGVGTVYRRFSSKDALVDELLRLALDEVLAATELALARTDGQGLEDLLRAIGQSFADHRRYATLLLERRTDDATGRHIREAIEVLTRRAAESGVIDKGVGPADVMALIWAMRGLIQADHGPDDGSPHVWERFLSLHLAGLQAHVG